MIPEDELAKIMKFHAKIIHFKYIKRITFFLQDNARSVDFDTLMDQSLFNPIKISNSIIQSSFVSYHQIWKNIDFCLLDNGQDITGGVITFCRLLAEDQVHSPEIKVYSDIINEGRVVRVDILFDLSKLEKSDGYLLSAKIFADFSCLKDIKFNAGLYPKTIYLHPETFYGSNVEMLFDFSRKKILKLENIPIDNKIKMFVSYRPINEFDPNIICRMLKLEYLYIPFITIESLFEENNFQILELPNLKEVTPRAIDSENLHRFAFRENPNMLIIKYFVCGSYYGTLYWELICNNIEFRNLVLKDSLYIVKRLQKLSANLSLQFPPKASGYVQQNFWEEITKLFHEMSEIEKMNDTIRYLIASNFLEFDFKGRLAHVDVSFIDISKIPEDLFEGLDTSRLTLTILENDKKWLMNYDTKEKDLERTNYLGLWTTIKINEPKPVIVQKSSGKKSKSS